MTSTTAFASGFSAERTVTWQVPSFIPVILPQELTVAISVLLEVQTSALFSAVSGSIVTQGMSLWPT